MFSQYLLGWTTLRDALKASDYRKAFHGFRIIVDATDDTVNGQNAVFAASPEQTEELTSVVAETCTLLGIAPPATEKIGDGKLLNVLKELLPVVIKVLPLFL